MINAVVFSSTTFQTFGLLDLQNFLRIIPGIVRSINVSMFLAYLATQVSRSHSQ